ncbi:MAG: triosephosphate isomerase [Candidatus Nanosalina sp. J07AB43]|jgi:triosephosphate isomerase|nr:MAG: triosephosphate isomerase [Candidatus Nanosalina sp. J07AB43]
MIIVNFKAYRQALGHKAEKMAKKCREASKETGERVIACPQPQDIPRVASTGTETIAQHVSYKGTGSNTGRISATGIKNAGASGTLVNHSERRLSPENVRKTVQKCEDIGLMTIVCAKDAEEVKKFNSYNPDFISIEPPELIGGQKPVSKSKPDLIQQAVENTDGSTETLTGAGIKTREDVQKAIELGCSGILVASGVIKSEKPKQKIKELCDGL